jgi:hypothetical protein
MMQLQPPESQDPGHQLFSMMLLPQPVLGKLRQENPEFEVRLSYIDLSQ